MSWREVTACLLEMPGENRKPGQQQREIGEYHPFVEMAAEPAALTSSNR
jgi:hypothetical protein